MNGRAWTTREIARMADMIGQDMTSQEIAAHLGRTERAVQLKANQLGFRKKRVAEIEAARIRREEELRIAFEERIKRIPQQAKYEAGFPKRKPCINDCGRTVLLESRNDPRKCPTCSAMHADLSHCEGVEAWA